MPEIAHSPDGKVITVTVPMRFRRRGGRRLVIQPEQVTPAVENLPHGDDTLPRTLARAFRWKRKFEEGRYGTLERLAAAEGLTKAYISRSLKLTLLAPAIVEAILDGQYDQRGLNKYLRGTIPESWENQLAEVARSLRRVATTTRAARSSQPTSRSPQGPTSEFVSVRSADRSSSHISL